MTDTSFHRTELGEFKSGQVIRTFDGPFGDATVLGFNDNGDMKVARPYVYVSGAGTTGPTPLTGVETFSIPSSQHGFYEIVEGSPHRDLDIDLRKRLTDDHR